jgi:hypothetical protein
LSDVRHRADVRLRRAAGQRPDRQVDAVDAAVDARQVAGHAGAAVSCVCIHSGISGGMIFFSPFAVS